eukprot:jgi/Mesvir1/16460/Mv03880-RA.1
MSGSRASVERLASEILRRIRAGAGRLEGQHAHIPKDVNLPVNLDPKLAYSSLLHVARTLTPIKPPGPASKTTQKQAKPRQSYEIPRKFSEHPALQSLLSQVCSAVQPNINSVSSLHAAMQESLIALLSFPAPSRPFPLVQRVSCAATAIVRALRGPEIASLATDMAALLPPRIQQKHPDAALFPPDATAGPATPGEPDRVRPLVIAFFDAVEEEALRRDMRGFELSHVLALASAFKHVGHPSAQKVDWVAYTASKKGMVYVLDQAMWNNKKKGWTRWPGLSGNL